MVSKEEVIKLAKLSKLSFEEKELENFQKDLNNIFNYMEELNELDLENIEPLYNVLDIVESRVYKDEVKFEMKKEDFLNNSAKHDDNFITLPIIVGDANE